MATSGQSRARHHAPQPAKVHRTAPLAPRPPPASRIGGGIRVVRTTEGPSNSKTVAQEHNGDLHSNATPLYKRLLYPGVADRPPRILQTPGTEQVDTQLYNLLALICRGFIAPWYSKISRDRAFFLEIVRVASHVFRQLEARLVDAVEDSHEHDDRASEPPQIDKIRFIFSSLPRILERHVIDFRSAQARSKSAYSAGIQSHNGLSTLETHFHSIQRHAAIQTVSPVEVSSLERLPATIDADYIRTAVDAILDHLLPKEDYTAETERSVVREVIVGIVLEGVFRKVARPWFMHALIVKLLDRQVATETANTADNTREGFSDDVQPATSAKQGVQDWWMRIACFAASLPILFSRLVALFGYLSFLFTTSFASSHYKRYSNRPGHLADITQAWTRLVLSMLQSDAEGRQTVSRVGDTMRTIVTVASPISDRIIVHYLYTRIFTTAFTSRLLQAVEEALFPGGYPAPAVPDPDAHEQALLKERAIAVVAQNLPVKATRLLMKAEEHEDSRLAVAEELLQPFSSHYANLHLFLFIFDTLLAEICPELVIRD